ncbi:MAG TPA: sulfite exporter TauE/SafE family protein [Alphaproteobacteria bacterium]|nr:sulfite exporter TauE/SafE family protein [Alphaproteobacteria bacterium]
MLEQLSPLQIVLMTVILVLAGMIKGVLGVGLPLVAVPLLSQVVPVPLAIMTLAIAQVVSNGFQAFQGGNLGAVLRRFWNLLLPLVAALFIGARLLVTLDDRMLGLILGIVVLVVTVFSRYQHRIRIEVRHERITNPVVGVLSGLLGGVSSFYGVPVLIYFVALKLEKRFFISAVSTAFTVGAVLLIASLIFYGAMGRSELVLSGLSVIPVFGGLLVGQLIQKRMPQEAFNKGLLVILLLTGISLVSRAIFQ